MTECYVCGSRKAVALEKGPPLCGFCHKHYAPDTLTLAEREDLDAVREAKIRAKYEKAAPRAPELPPEPTTAPMSPPITLCESCGYAFETMSPSDATKCSSCIIAEQLSFPFVPSP